MHLHICNGLEFMGLQIISQTLQPALTTSCDMAIFFSPSKPHKYPNQCLPIGNRTCWNHQLFFPADFTQMKHGHLFQLTLPICVFFHFDPIRIQLLISVIPRFSLCYCCPVSVSVVVSSSKTAFIPALAASIFGFRLSAKSESSNRL